MSLFTNSLEDTLANTSMNKQNMQNQIQKHMYSRVTTDQSQQATHQQHRHLRVKSGVTNVKSISPGVEFETIGGF